jgi:hypothetical protein
MIRRASLSVLFVAAACYTGPVDAPRSEIVGGDDDDEAWVAELAAPPAERTLRHPAAGWLDHEESPIQPWCGAVLVAPDVAITSARCVDGWDKSFLNFGLGPADADPHEIAEIVMQKSDVIPREQSLAAVRLVEPITGVAPAELTVSREAACDVESISYLFVLRGEDGSRDTWRGCLVGSELRANSGAPNCHGDMGAGAFLSDGALVGVSVDAFSEGACVPGHRLATVADNEAFFQLALDLSQPPA